MKGSATRFLSSLLFGVIMCILAADAILLALSPLWVHEMYQSGGLWLNTGVIGAISLPAPFNSESFMLVFVILSGFALGALLLENARLLANVRKGNPFCMQNAKALKLCAWFSLAQMALFTAKLIERPTVLTFGCALIFLLACLLYFVLADLFHSAALLREDNDLTI